VVDSLHKRDANLLQVLTPFFAPVCAMHSGELFEAAAFSDAVFTQYGLRVPRLAILGLAEQLEGAGLLVSVGGNTAKPVYKYAAAKVFDADDAHPVSEAEVDQVLSDFVLACRDDPLLANETNEKLQEEFLDRLLHTDSMRLLSRRDGSSVTKKDDSTLTLKRRGPEVAEHRDLRLDFHVSQYLVDLQSEKPVLFNRVSDIAFANMAAEALACFSEPVGGASSLDGLTVYLDSPLLLDILGVNVEYTEYGTELLQMIQDAGAQAAVFDDCIAEAESVVAAQIAAQSHGLANRTAHWGMNAKPHVLNALSNNIASRAEAKGLQVHRDPNVDLLARAKTTVGDIQAEMTKRMHAWPNDEARRHDEQSVWAMLRVRRSAAACSKVSESKHVFIARNTALVRIANDAWRMWLQDTTKHSRNTIDRWAPVAMSDKQLAGYLWLRRGTGNGKISKARLLAHCSAAIRPRAEVKAKAYSLVLSLHGREDAEHIAALFDDREGERALMRATRADPEDVTKERLPYIIEQVKLAAGEFAAQAVREQAEETLNSTKAQFQRDLEAITSKAEEEKILAQDAVQSISADLAQERFDKQVLSDKVAALEKRQTEKDLLHLQEDIKKLEKAFAKGHLAYWRMRIELVMLFGAISLGITTSATEWQPIFQLATTFLLTCVGFWFVPEFLEPLVQKFAHGQLASYSAELGMQRTIPVDAPEFKEQKWLGLDQLRSDADSMAAKLA
jgi:hypothetical protein